MELQVNKAAPRTKPVPHPRRFQEGWLHLCNGLDPVRDGGMVPSILGMTGALVRLGGQPVTIVTPTPSNLGDIELPEGLHLQGPETDLEGFVRNASVVHTHGLWQGHTRRGTKAARASRVPYLMAAHGHAEPWSLRHKAWKKKLYAALIEGKNLRHAACLHALSRPEIGHLRALAPRSKVCFIPNGVDLAPFEALPPSNDLEISYPELQGKFVLLFYGRLHRKKGLDLLARAFAEVSKDHGDLHLLLAGNDDGALGPFLKQSAELGVASKVTALGHVSGETTRRVWSRADAFLLPSYSEGFSMAILEALAARCPVLATTACHFPELAKHHAGIVVEPTAETVTDGLSRLLEMSSQERAEMASRGRSLVETRYTWDRQATRLASVYLWLAGGGAEPDAVLEASEHSAT